MNRMDITQANGGARVSSRRVRFHNGVLKSATAVRARVEEIVVATYMPATPDKNAMFLEKRVYQGSSGKVDLVRRPRSDGSHERYARRLPASGPRVSGVASARV